MSNGPLTHIPETLRFRPIPHGDPPPWVLSHLTKEQLMQVYRVQLEFEKTLNAAQGKLLEGLASAIK